MGEAEAEAARETEATCAGAIWDLAAFGHLTPEQEAAAVRLCTDPRLRLEGVAAAVSAIGLPPATEELVAAWVGLAAAWRVDRQPVGRRSA